MYVILGKKIVSGIIHLLNGMNYKLPSSQIHSKLKVFNDSCNCFFFLFCVAWLLVIWLLVSCMWCVASLFDSEWFLFPVLSRKSKRDSMIEQSYWGRWILHYKPNKKASITKISLPVAVHFAVLWQLRGPCGKFHDQPHITTVVCWYI